MDAHPTIRILALLPVVLLVMAFGSWLGWQLLRQNGRILLRLEAIEDRLNLWELEGDPSGDGKSKSLTRSRLNRDGLKAGTPAPGFRLPRVDGGELSLEEFRGRCVLLVFSDPECGPCNQLAPRLEEFHRVNPGLALVMISRRDAEANRAKIEEHRLTFPVLLQKHWEISLRYAMFATPIAYLIDERGVIENDVAVGVEPILALLVKATNHAKEKELVAASLISRRFPAKRIRRRKQTKTKEESYERQIR